MTPKTDTINIKKRSIMFMLEGEVERRKKRSRGGEIRTVMCPLGLFWTSHFLLFILDTRLLRHSISSSASRTVGIGCSNFAFAAGVIIYHCIHLVPGLSTVASRPGSSVRKRTLLLRILLTRRSCRALAGRCSLSCFLRGLLARYRCFI